MPEAGRGPLAPDGGIPDLTNLAAAEADLAAARAAGDEDQSTLLRTLLDCGGTLVLYHPERRHYGVRFGEIEGTPHVAVVVPGVGDETNLREDWIPAARHLFDAAPSTAVVLWKGYDNPPNLLHAAVEVVECDEGLVAGGRELTEFVSSLSLRPDQTLTVVAHSFGSMVTGAALADCGLRCTDVVVAGSPGMTVDDLRELHMTRSHFFSEEAPGDAIAELGVFGASPTSPAFQGTRMRTNAPGHLEVMAHSSYFVPGSEALENIVDVVVGRYSSVLEHHPSVAEVAGGLVAWVLRIPTRPIGTLARHYRGPGFRVVVNARQAVDLTATETGNLVRDALDNAGGALTWVARRLAGGDRSAGRGASPPNSPRA
jgi:pimeloyl-ACP methyl ester carboxylesterase